MPVSGTYRNGHLSGTIVRNRMVKMAQQHAQTSELRHRRDTWLWLVLPMAALALLIVAAVAVLVFVPRNLHESQTSVVADLMLAVLMLCPAVVCMLPVTILALGSVVGLNRVHGMMTRPLRALETHSETLATKAAASSAIVNRKTIDFSSRLGFIYKHFETFEQKPNQEDIEPHG
jgi:high-affinity K+ transport system ATPase subunit B